MTSEVDCGSVDSTVESGEMSDLKKITINGIKSCGVRPRIQKSIGNHRGVKGVLSSKTICFDGF